MASRSGFHKPDPNIYPPYKHTRRIHLEDINTNIYNDNAPEFHMHLHSLQIKSGKAGWFYISCYFMMIIFPCWMIGRKCHKDAGAILMPCVRPGIDHAHMAPKLCAHLHAHDYEN